MKGEPFANFAVVGAILVEVSGATVQHGSNPGSFKLGSVVLLSLLGIGPLASS